MAFKVHIVFYLTICFLLLIIPQSYSQYGDIRFELLSKEKGLEDGTVFCITQDSKGFLWVGGGESGLYRYDGYSFKPFHHNPEDPEYWYKVLAETFFRIDYLEEKKCHCSECNRELTELEEFLPKIKKHLIELRVEN